MSLQEIANLTGKLFHFNLQFHLTCGLNTFQLLVIFRVKASLQWRAWCMTQRKEGNKGSQDSSGNTVSSSWPDKRAWKKNGERWTAPRHHFVRMQYRTTSCTKLHEQKRAQYCLKISLEKSHEKNLSKWLITIYLVSLCNLKKKILNLKSYKKLVKMIDLFTIYLVSLAF